MIHAIQLFHPLVNALAGCPNRHQQAVIDYLIEENRQRVGMSYIPKVDGGILSGLQNRFIKG